MMRSRLFLSLLSILVMTSLSQDVFAQKKTNFQDNQVTGHEAFVSGGRANRAFGAESFIGGGYKNTTDGELSLVVGGQFNTTRNDFATIGGGYVNEVKGQFATIPGGWWLKAPSFGEVAVGYLNTIYAPMSPVSAHPRDRIFTVGNGRTEVISAIETRQNRSDAFYILKGGDAMLSGRLYMGADTINYVSVDTLTQNHTDFSALDVLQYKWEGNTGFRNRYDLNFGLNGAQVKKYYPNLVSTDGLGFLTVDYIGFVPLLIEDSKNKNVIIDSLTVQIDEKDQEIEALNNRLNNIELMIQELKQELDGLKPEEAPTDESEEQESEGNNESNNQ